MTTVQRVAPPFLATPRQAELAKAWRDPNVTRLLASGAIRSGKTQGASRLLIETALTHQSLYLVARQTYRSLKDTTQRAMLYGDGPLPPLIPSEALRGQSLDSGYRASDERVFLANGSEILFRSLEDNNPEKVRGLTLGGVLIDQIEELRFDGGERLYDEICGRLSDGRGPQKLLAIANPAGLTHWVYRRFVQQPDQGSALVHFTMLDNAMNLEAGYVEQMEATKHTRPGWYRTFVLGEWGAIEDAAYQIEPAHMIPDFRLDDSFKRFEAADYGFNGAPWALVAVDYDGNLIFVDMLYEKDLLPSELTPLVLAKRRGGWGDNNDAYIDPSIWKRMGARNKWGAPAMLADEFTDNGIHVIPANNDPRAGMARLRELLRLDKDHRFPPWHGLGGEPGAPRVFFTHRCERLVQELRSAPVQPLDKTDGGEKVDPDWESQSGHAAAMARYAVMSRPDPSVEPTTEPEDERERMAIRMLERARNRSDLQPV